MMQFLGHVLPYLIIAAMAATVAVLAVGVVSMLRGGAFDKRNSNKLMRMRVAFQALAVLLFGIFLWLGRHYGAGAP
ncbi:MAG: twin transmembrane helix small protein [Alphaproteobacteria bacterium]